MKCLFLIFLVAMVCMTEAQRCSTMCIALYDPVCGVNDAGDERTFSNDCRLDAHNCRNPGNRYRLLRNGVC